MNSTNAERGAETSAEEGQSVPAGTAEVTPAQTETARAGTAHAETSERDASAVIEALNAENSQLKDRVLRTLAEMENLRRRTDREVSDAKTYAVTGFARDVLTVVDNLARALEHLPAEARAAADPQ